MGTSKNSSGSTERSPLVPPHADPEPNSPIPPRPERGLSNFRLSLTSFVKSGDSRLRDRTLGRYARGAVGGSSVGYRRYGAVAESGSTTIGALSELAEGGSGEIASGQNLSAAIGAPVEQAAQIIAEAIAPDSVEGDSIRILMQEAVCEALEGQGTLERELITETFIDHVVFEFLVEAIMHDLWSIEGSPSLDAADSPEVLQSRENDMREVVRATVDGRLVQIRGDETLTSMSSDQRRQFQLDTVRAVLEVWEALPE